MLALWAKRPFLAYNTDMDLTAVCQTAQDIAREAGAYLKQGLDQPKAITRKSSDIDWGNPI